MAMATWLRKTVKMLDRNLPHILTAIGLGTMIKAVSSAVSDGPKIKDALEKEKRDKADNMSSEEREQLGITVYENSTESLSSHSFDLSKINLTLWEKFKTVAPIQWRTWVYTGVAGACFIASDVVHTKRFAAVAMAAALSNKRLNEIEEKVKEVLGEKKSNQVKQEIAKDHAMNVPKDIQDQYVVGRLYPCYLSFADLYFLGDRSTIQMAFNAWNAAGLEEGEMDLESLIDELEIPVKDTWLYQKTTWCLNSKKDIVKPIITGSETIDGVPCLSVDVSRYPDRY